MVPLMVLVCLVQAPETLDVTAVGKDPRWQIAGRTTAVIDANGKHALKMIEVAPIRPAESGSLCDSRGLGGSSHGAVATTGPRKMMRWHPATMTVTVPRIRVGGLPAPSCRKDRPEGQHAVYVLDVRRGQSQ